MTPTFSEELKRLLEQEGYTPGDVIRQVRVQFGDRHLLTSSTLDRWLSGGTKKPRDWRPVVAIAAVLRLSHHDADSLLESAGLPDIATLRRQAQTPDDERYLTSFEPEEEGSLKICEVRWTASNDELEFLVKNESVSDAIVYRATLRLVELKERQVLGYLAVSGRYDLDVTHLAQKGDEVSCELSQRVKARSADRFAIRLLLTSPRPERRKLVLQPSLDTDEGLIISPRLVTATLSSRPNSYSGGSPT